MGMVIQKRQKKKLSLLKMKNLLMLIMINIHKSGNYQDSKATMMMHCINPTSQKRKFARKNQVIIMVSGIKEEF